LAALVDNVESSVTPLFLAKIYQHCIWNIKHFTFL